MSPETIVVLVTAVVAQIVTIYTFRKSQPLRQREVEAEAANDLASAEARRIENYNQVFETLLRRDQQIIELNARVTKLSVEFEAYRTDTEATIEDLNQQLTQERELRLMIQKQRDGLQKTVTELQSKVAALEERLRRFVGDDPST